MTLAPASAPTLYFFGVTTAKSSIMKVFPAWAKHLGLAGAVIKGVDLPLHAPAAEYRSAVEFVKNDPLSLGALVTTHKIDLYHACRDQFDEIDPHARFMGETSCLSKRDGRLICHAKDPISSGLSLDGFLPELHFERTGAEVFSMGAGGSTIALTWHLMQREPRRRSPGADRRLQPQPRAARGNPPHPRRARLGRSDRICPLSMPSDNDAVLSGLRPGSLVINATGLGKDAPGSPLTNSARFPDHAIVWDLNYRGELVFLDQARAQSQALGLQIEDGWTYFLHGWTQVIAEVFHISIPVRGKEFDALSDIALRAVKE